MQRDDGTPLREAPADGCKGEEPAAWQPMPQGNPPSPNPGRQDDQAEYQDQPMQVFVSISIMSATHA